MGAQFKDQETHLAQCVLSGIAQLIQKISGLRDFLVGETTFGKGVVQTFMDLSDGSGLKLTIAKWLTPNGRWIQGTGLTPDRVVPAATAGSADDPVLTAALSLLE